jgi:hypothetical protein
LRLRCVDLVSRCVLIIPSGVFAATQGLAKGDVAAIFMTNKPQYVMIELALAKVRGDTSSYRWINKYRYIIQPLAPL